MGRRYRSLRKAFKMNVAPGKIILWDGHRFPPKGQPACTDKEINDFIESRPGFGKLFWKEQNPDEILVDPAKLPKDCEAEHLQKAAERLADMGINVNPAILVDPDEEPQLPSKTSVSSMKRKELEELVKKFEWDDIDITLNVKDLKKVIREKVEASQ